MIQEKKFINHLKLLKFVIVLKIFKNTFNKKYWCGIISVLSHWFWTLLFKFIKNDLSYIFSHIFQDYWPREIPFEDDDKWLYTLKKIEEDTSFSSIYTHLWGKVPRIYDRSLYILDKFICQIPVLQIFSLNLWLDF